MKGLTEKSKWQRVYTIVLVLNAVYILIFYLLMKLL